MTCAHCFNTLRNEYPQLGGDYEVVHHTQLLNRLVREKRLVPVRKPTRPRRSPRSPPAPRVRPGRGRRRREGVRGCRARPDGRGITANRRGAGGGGGPGRQVTYHDPCYLGRHNQVYTPPRELIGATGVTLTEMPRNADRSFCCGAGGARMWMEEKVGKRINLERTDEALGTGAKTIVTGCPFCRVMLTDGVTARQNTPETADTAPMSRSTTSPTCCWPPSNPAAPGRTGRSGQAGSSAGSSPSIGPGPKSHCSKVVGSVMPAPDRR